MEGCQVVTSVLEETARETFSRQSSLKRFGVRDPLLFPPSTLVFHKDCLVQMRE